MSTPRGSGMDAGGPGDQGLALGVDITSISRIEGVLRRHPRFAEKIFTEAERNRCGTRAERFASRWAAKEAVMKLHGQLGLRIPPYHAIEVVNRRGGAPVIRIDGRDTGIAVSLTHDAGVAIAVAALPALGPQGAPALPPPRELRLPDRPDDAHKGTFGLVVVVAGAMGTAGAAVLAARGAARAGAGLVRLCVPAGIYAAVAGQCAQAFFLQNLAGGVVVEELNLGDGGRADEACLLVELRANFHAAGATDTVRQRIVDLLLLRVDARTCA